MTEDRRPLPPELRDELSHRPEGAELAQVWDLLAIADPVRGSPDTDAAWGHVSAQLAAGRPRLTPVAGTPVVPTSVRATPPSPTPTRATPAVARPVRWRRTVGTALAATLAVAVGVGAWSARPVTVSAPAGAQYTLSLPDGSVVELNAGSTLRYAHGFRARLGWPASRRTVRLEGEAFFSVEHTGRPFEVLTDEARVTVLGTRFLVRARAEGDEGTRVAVESGRVRVTSASDGVAASAIELAAGQGTVVTRNAAPTPATAIGVERLTLWRRGGLAFVDQPLAAIVRELERRYAVEIRLREVAVSDERITYYAGQPSIETVLGDLCTPRGLRYTRTSRGFEISPVLEAGPTTP